MCDKEIIASLWATRMITNTTKNNAHRNALRNLYNRKGKIWAKQCGCTNCLNYIEFGYYEKISRGSLRRLLDIIKCDCFKCLAKVGV